MATLTEWIKDQMLGSPDNHKRQLTEAEMKVVRSLKKLSIPDWYLNKCSSPPKILNNPTPIDCRPPTWKNLENKKKSAAPKNLSETFSKESSDASRDRPTEPDTGTYKITRQLKEPKETTVEKSEPFDTWIPKVKLSKKISRSFPKTSPPRKIQNINIVLPAGPPLNITDSTENLNNANNARLSTFGLKRQRFEVGARYDKMENGRRVFRSVASSGKTSSEAQTEKGQGTVLPVEELWLRAELSSEHENLNKGKMEEEEEEEDANSTLRETTSPCSCAQNERQKSFLTWTRSRRSLSQESPSKEEQKMSGDDQTPQAEKKTPRKGRTIALIVRNPYAVARLRSAVGRDNDDHGGSTGNCQTPGKGRPIALLLGSSEFSTPNVKGVFRVRAASTPRGNPVNLFSSVLMDEVSEEGASEDASDKTLDRADAKELSSGNFTETSRAESGESSTEGSRVKGLRAKFDRSLTENTETKPVPYNNKYQKTQETGRKTTAALLAENKLRSVEPILFEKDENAFAQHPRSVREFVRKINANVQPELETVSKKSLNVEKPKTDLQRKPSLEKPIGPTFHPASPSTRFLYSNRKSTELENIVKSKQTVQGSGLVREIIKELTERRDSLGQKRIDMDLSRGENFVRKLVDALEKGEKPEKVLGEEGNRGEDYDTGSSSSCESDIRPISCTSASVKDTDSSDLEQRSPSLESEGETRFKFATSATFEKTSASTDRTLEECEAAEEEEEEEEDGEDSVYWIPVSRCQLPRTSSLLSMMSRLSTTGHRSPCVSPIKYNESESEHPGPWGVTLKRTNGLGKLGRIEETAITDSGYSEKSDKSDRSAGSVSGSSVNDEPWTEGPRADSAVAGCKGRSKRSSARRKTIVGRRVEY